MLVVPLMFLCWEQAYICVSLRFPPEVAFLTCGLTLASVEVGESVNAKGGIKFEAGATKAGAQAGYPEGAKSAVMLNLDLRADHKPEHAQTICDIATKVMETFVEPMLEGMAEEFQMDAGTTMKPYHSFSFTHADNVLSLKLYSGIDLGQPFEGTGMSFEKLIPTVAFEEVWGFKLSDFTVLDGTTTKSGDMFNFGVKSSFTWNTMLMQALAHVGAELEGFFNSLDSGAGADAKRASMVFKTINGSFKSQNSNVEFFFEDWKEFTAAWIEEILVPLANQEAERMYNLEGWWQVPGLGYAEEPEGYVQKLLDVMFNLTPSATACKYAWDKKQAGDNAFTIPAILLAVPPMGLPITLPDDASGLDGCTALTQLSLFALVMKSWTYLHSVALPEMLTTGMLPMDPADIVGDKLPLIPEIILTSLLGIKDVRVETTVASASVEFTGLDFMALLPTWGQLTAGVTKENPDLQGLADLPGASPRDSNSGPTAVSLIQGTV